MLFSLKIENLILIEKAEIAFGSGLNILTGETGSGKSAILSAIRLISGERADMQLIRKGADLAVVEAVLTGIACEGEDLVLPPAGTPLHVRREIHRSGKNRCFIEDQQVSLSFLRKCTSIERVDQSSSLTLCSLDQQRILIDAFGGLSAEAAAFELSFGEEKKIEAELQSLFQSQIQRERELEWTEKDLALIVAVNWRPDEEEKLAQEHHFLTHAQELAEKMGAVSSGLTEGAEPLIPALKRVAAALEHCTRFDAKLIPIAGSMKSALLELEEGGRSIRTYVDGLEADPGRLLFIEKRIAELESIKRRFGRTFIEVEQQKEQLLAKIDRLTHLDEQIKTIRATLEVLKKKNSTWAQEIYQKRRAAGIRFAAQVLEELKSLNIPHARFELAEDEIRFLFSANPGVSPIPLEQCASGGELSRLLLAIKVILSEGSSCLVFDEIDSNVGGQTATILGEKLKRLSSQRQVICVTHFVQVAKCAMDHFLVAKTEKEGNAYTTIEKLNHKNRELEYNRMLGTI